MTLPLRSLPRLLPFCAPEALSPCLVMHCYMALGTDNASGDMRHISSAWHWFSTGEPSGYPMGEWAQIWALLGHFPDRFCDCSVPQFPYLCSGNDSCSAPRVTVQNEVAPYLVFGDIILGRPQDWLPVLGPVPVWTDLSQAGFLSCPTLLLRPTACLQG